MESTRTEWAAVSQTLVTGGVDSEEGEAPGGASLRHIRCSLGFSLSDGWFDHPATWQLEPAV